MMVQGLEKTELPEAKTLAFQLAEKRIQSAYLNFLKKGHMYEKYDATSMSKVGGGGEYEIQLGFGWTNGVVLDFIDMYHDKLSTKTFTHLTQVDNIPEIINDP
jgi:alpha,alpha-trehalase